VLYHWFELSHAAFRPARVAADTARMVLSNPFNPLTHTSFARHTVAALEVFERTTRRYGKPEFGIPTTTIEGQSVDVREEIVWQRPFCRMIHFRRDVSPEKVAKDPRILLVAPMSGHFATLLRGTVEAFLPDHEVYITDWIDARDVPLGAGTFDLDDYIDYMADMFRFFRGDIHVFAVCQPSVAASTGTALMEEDQDPFVPQSLMLAGGPIDTRVSPTAVNKLAEQRGTNWFANNVITSVPWPNIGFGRRVYPGFLQLTGFMTMNLDRHLKAHKDLFFHLVRGDGDSSDKHKEFYDEYLAVMDLTREFYLQTIDSVFVKHDLPLGRMLHRGRPVDLSKIERVALMTIEGEKDDITGIGQCAAAIDLCSGIKAADKLHFECPGVGHYGIFNGSRFRSEIAPRMANFLRRYDPRTVGRASAHFMMASERGKQTGDRDADAFSFGRKAETNGAARPDDTPAGDRTLRH
jgi:poly(3-hydroxybutyrate) depolymerase